MRNRSRHAVKDAANLGLRLSGLEKLGDPLTQFLIDFSTAWHVRVPKYKP
jgi:hypothetical protein